MNKKKLMAYQAITFVMIIWGLSFLSIKVAVAVFGPMTLALSRFIIASAILMVILKLREPESKLKKQDVPRMAVSGIVGITIYFFFENNGVKLTTASTASIIIAAIPMLTVISDYIFCGNRITLAKGVGVLLSFSGVFLIVRESGQLSFTSTYFVGNLLMLGAAAAWVVYSLVTRPLGGRYSQLAITTYQTLFGTLAILPFAFFETNNWARVDSVVAGNIIFLGVLCSAMGYYLYVYAIGELGVHTSSLFINLIPVVTVVASYFILDEKITPVQLMGGGVVVLAVYLSDISRLIKKLFKPTVGQLPSEKAEDV